MTMSTDCSLLELLQPLRGYVASILSRLEEEPSLARTALITSAEFVCRQAAAGQSARMNFICTHNSRRSHLGHVWAQVAATFYQLEHVETYSGGTEATACNHRTAAALRRTGFSVVQLDSTANPKFMVQYTEVPRLINLFSKVYNQQGNPTRDYAAMMCCADVDEQCPIIDGASLRIPLHYDDPKHADDTPEEGQRYDERCRQIAEEMFFVMAMAKDALAK